MDYEAYETSENNLLKRTGSRTITFYDYNLDKVLENKEKEYIIFDIGLNTFTANYHTLLDKPCLSRSRSCVFISNLSR
jgi:hypothetical protein